MRMSRSKLNILETKFYRAPLKLVEQDDQQAPAEPDPTDAPADASQEEQPSPAAEADLGIQIQKVSETSADFDSQVQKGLAAISEEIRQLLSEAGYSVATASLMSDALHDDPNQPGIPWSLASGAALLEQKQVLVAESVLDKNGSPQQGLNPEGLVKVGIGHILNSMAPQFIAEKDQDLFSNLESFKYAHTSDVARLGADKKQKLAFYIDDAEASRSECFAECFAAMSGGGAVYTLDVMSKYFPAVVKQMKDISNAIKTGSKMSGTPEDTTPAQAPSQQLPENPAANASPASDGAQ